MTNNPLDLYAYAENRNIDVDWIPMRRATSLSVPLGDGYAIALDPWKLGTPALADRFDVTEAFMRKAICWYAHGNLAVEMYA